MTYPPGLQVWWKTYANAIRPRPMSDKQICVREWKSLKLELVGDVMLEKLKARISHGESCAENGDFCPRLPDPKRYLRRKMWLDELPAEIQPADPAPEPETAREVVCGLLARGIRDLGGKVPTPPVLAHEAWKLLTVAGVEVDSPSPDLTIPSDAIHEAAVRLTEVRK